MPSFLTRSNFISKVKFLILNVFFFYLLCCFCLKSLRKALAEVLDCCVLYVYSCSSYLLSLLFLPLSSLYLLLKLNLTSLSTFITTKGVHVRFSQPLATSHQSTSQPASHQLISSQPASQKPKSASQPVSHPTSHSSSQPSSQSHSQPATQSTSQSPS